MHTRSKWDIYSLAGSPPGYMYSSLGDGEPSPSGYPFAEQRMERGYHGFTHKLIIEALARDTPAYILCTFLLLQGHPTWRDELKQQLQDCILSSARRWRLQNARLLQCMICCIPADNGQTH
eukprot:jgi/Chlat1/6273/Chrsp44S05863